VLRGREHFDAALAGGTGMILALPHSGNWDMGGFGRRGALRPIHHPSPNA
ncbi:hypothetical protein H7H37_04860, partial [Mycolicibacterium insubricum]|nr:hypothetical protein [Mycolicibacterium insubricum]